jgi:hypothetical protein
MNSAASLPSFSCELRGTVADDNVLDQIKTAENEAKLVLLQQIKELAGKTHVESKIQTLAHAYALTVGANLGKLPGAPTA